MADVPLASTPRWLVWRPGCPDPSVRTAVIVYEQPAAKVGVHLIGPAHREMTIAELMREPCYQPVRGGAVVPYVGAAR